jgi:hypothetical protein
MKISGLPSCCKGQGRVWNIKRSGCQAKSQDNACMEDAILTRLFFLEISSKKNKYREYPELERKVNQKCTLEALRRAYHAILENIYKYVYYFLEN